MHHPPIPPAVVTMSEIPSGDTHHRAVSVLLRDTLHLPLTVADLGVASPVRVVLQQPDFDMADLQQLVQSLHWQLHKGNLSDAAAAGLAANGGEIEVRQPIDGDDDCWWQTDQYRALQLLDCYLDVPAVRARLDDADVRAMRVWMQQPLLLRRPLQNRRCAARPESLLMVLNQALKYPSPATVETLLWIRPPIVDCIASQLPRLLEWSCRNGHAAVVERLLQDPRVDPAAMDNEALRLASQYGHLAVVERLLQDGRVDPAADDNAALRMASLNGHLAVVERLLQDVRVDPAALESVVLQYASMNGHLAIVERLLQDPRVDPVADDNEAL